MRPGMPPGRKHFRRSRDAPIYCGKDCWTKSSLSKIVVQKNISTLADGRSLSKALDEGKQQDDSWNSREIKAVQALKLFSFFLLIPMIAWS